MSSYSSAGRLAQNTSLLYIRQILIVIIGLYTSRVILKILGFEDFGIYNIAGGVVAMLAFLNSAMTAATQRFISYGVGKGDIELVRKSFTSAIYFHLLTAIILFFFAETFGLWFLNNQLNISDERMRAANWVYQSSICITIFTIMSVPYNSLLVAYEYMKVFAYLGLMQAIFKLGITFLLFISPWDKLITYSILGAFIQILFQFVYMWYCKKHFAQSLVFMWPGKRLFLKMSSFAGWSIIGNLGFSFKDQASNIILNLFFGPSVNAARGIALSVFGIVNSFTQNFLMALNPQITKDYAIGNIDKTTQMVYLGCRLSPLFMGIIFIPIVTNMDNLLSIWLEEVPPYTNAFLSLTLIVGIMQAIAYPLVTAIQATGKIKIFQITISIVMLSELPIAYGLLKWGAPPYAVIYPAIVISFIGVYIRFSILKHFIPIYRYGYFSYTVIAKVLLVLLLSYLSSMFLHKEDETIVSLIQNGIMSFIVTIIFILTFGISGMERKKAYSIICKKNKKNEI